MKEIAHGTTRTHETQRLLRRITDAAACIREHPEMIQQAVNSCLERPLPVHKKPQQTSWTVTACAS